jgi:hypothetical protein
LNLRLPGASVTKVFHILRYYFAYCFFGRVELSDRGELVVYFGSNSNGAYLADAADEGFAGCDLVHE